jgi:mono/diheme cytochrome c family protein
MIAGAPNLRLSTLSLEDIKALIRHGKGMMPPYKDLSDAELEALAQFVKSLQE